MAHYSFTLDQNGMLRTTAEGHYAGPLPHREFKDLDEVRQWIDEEASWLSEHEVELLSAA